MDERFNVCEIHICPVYKVGTSFKPDMEYPTRYCVIDKENKIAIDIKTKLKYNYIATMNHLYFLNDSSKNIKGDNRVAIFPYAPILISDYNLDEASIIIEQLKNNVDFQDGNEVYDNKSYLEILKEEVQKESQNKKKKVKIFEKRKK